MSFRILIVSLDPDNYYTDPGTGEFAEYETGQEAKAACDELSAASPDGTKYRVKRVLDKRWRTREQDKFDRGVYQDLPWRGQGWWRTDAAYSIYKHQYPHPSRKEPGMIAYTASDEQGMDNRHTRVKPGRYLEQFADILNKYDISAQNLANEFRRCHEPKALFIADTEDMVQWVYETGPESCMSGRTYREKHGWGWGKPGKWPNDIHAARMYIKEDLAVAYLTDNDKPKSKVISRSVIWPAKKWHGRCYGDETRMKSALINAGFKFTAPLGAKIQRVPIKGSRLFIVPYIDAGYSSGQGALAVKDKKTHLEICRTAPGAYPANTTSGACGNMLDAHGRPQHLMPSNCGSCGRDVDDCGPLQSVHISHAGGDANYWCERCISRDAYQCAHSGRFYSSAHVPWVEMVGGARWSERSFRNNGFRCSGNGRNYPMGSGTQLVNGEYWSTEWFEEHGFRCDYSGDAYPNSERVNLADGHVMATRSFARHGFTCRDCNRNLLLSDRHGRSVPGEQPQCVRCHTEAVTATMANDPANRDPQIARTEENVHE